MKRTFLVSIVAALTLGVSSAEASRLVYKPLNPQFGGNPLVANFLLDSARLQNNFGQSSGGNGGGGSAPSFDFGDFGGGPVIVINPPSGDVDAPDINVDTP